MSNEITIEADLLRVGYNVGYFEKADIVRWADRQIEACDDPPTQLLDLSMIRESHSIDVMNLLKSLGSSNPSAAIDTQIGFFGLLYTTGDISTQAVVRGLFALVHEPGITQEQQGQIYYLDDGYDLAVAGSYGSLGDIERELNEFFTPYAKQLAGNHPQLIPRKRQE